MTDPTLAQIADDSATAALMAAAMASGDQIEIEHVLDNITSTDDGKRLFSAMGGLYVSLASAVCADRIDVSDWLHNLALEQAQVADSLRGES